LPGHLPAGSGLPDDGYRLHAAPGEGVVINAGGPAGVFYGAQTLRLLLPPETLRKAPAQGVPAALELPAVDIEDAPRYAWRGVHLDVARHFFPKAWLSDTLVPLSRSCTTSLTPLPQRTTSTRTAANSFAITALSSGAVPADTDILSPGRRG
jgi:hypothetical protein